MTDPIVNEILATVLWFIFADLIVVLVFWGLVALSTVIGAALDKTWVAVIGYILSVFAAIGAIIFVWSHIITHAVAAARLMGWIS